MAQSKLELILELKDRMRSGLSSARASVNTATAEMRERINQLRTESVRAFAAIRDEIPGVGRALELLKNPFVAATAGVIGLATAFTACTRSANEWHEQMAAINVTAEQTPAQLSKLSNRLLEIGGRNAAPLEEVPKAFNKIISAGLSVNDSLATIEPTLLAAKAGFTDIETTASAATSTMMSAGVDAAKAFDVLFATMKEGNAEFKDIANYLPKIIPLARNVGFSLEETAGAFASLTSKLSPHSASTALEGAMRAFSSGNVVKSMGKIGIKVFDADTGKARSVLEIVKDLGVSMQGLTDKQRMLKFETLGLDQSASLALSTMMQDIPGLQKAIEATTASQGALNKAYQDAAAPLDSWKIAQNQIKVDMIRIGEIFLPIVAQIGMAVSAAMHGIKAAAAFIWDWREVIIGVAGAFALLNIQLIAAGVWTGIMSVATSIWTAAQWVLNVALSANPIGIIIVAIGALIGIIVHLMKKYEGWGTLWNALKVTLINGFKQYVANWKFGFQELWYAVQIFWAKIKSFGEFAGQLFINIGKAIKAALSGNFAEARDILKTEIKTKSSLEVENLEKERNLNRDRFAQESVQRAKEIAESWQNVSITKKKEEAKENATTGDAATIGAGNSGVGAGPGDGTGDGTGPGGKSKTSESVTGAARQIRNIMVNIDAFNKGGINAGNTSGLNGLNAEQVENWFNDMLMRTIRNLEESY
jgi:TP901 family phage tail tape measure protein